MRQAAVVGLGDPMQGDAGVGARVVRELGPRVADGIECRAIDGTPEALLEVLTRHPEVIFVEAVRGGEPPGTIYRLTPADLEAERPAAPRSAHGSAVAAALREARRLGAWCHVVVIGVEPGEAGRSADLSPQVWASLPVVTECVEREIAAFAGRRRAE